MVDRYGSYCLLLLFVSGVCSFATTLLACKSTDNIHVIGSGHCSAEGATPSPAPADLTPLTPAMLMDRWCFRLYLIAWIGINAFQYLLATRLKRRMKKQQQNMANKGDEGWIDWLVSKPGCGRCKKQRARKVKARRREEARNRRLSAQKCGETDFSATKRLQMAIKDGEIEEDFDRVTKSDYLEELQKKEGRRELFLLFHDLHHYGATAHGREELLRRERENLQGGASPEQRTPRSASTPHKAKGDGEGLWRIAPLDDNNMAMMKHAHSPSHSLHMLAHAASSTPRAVARLVAGVVGDASLAPDHPSAPLSTGHTSSSSSTVDVQSMAGATVEMGTIPERSDHESDVPLSVEKCGRGRLKLMSEGTCCAWVSPSGHVFTELMTPQWRRSWGLRWLQDQLLMLGIFTETGLVDMLNDTDLTKTQLARTFGYDVLKWRQIFRNRVDTWIAAREKVLRDNAEKELRMNDEEPGDAAHPPKPPFFSRATFRSNRCQ